jgi:DNA-binding NarL/FixJ family response regulator
MLLTTQTEEGVLTMVAERRNDCAERRPEQSGEKVKAGALNPISDRNLSLDDIILARASTVLSPKEAEIARLVAKGMLNKTIADVLGISKNTVAAHLRSIYAKLGIHCRTAVVTALLDATD